MNASVSPNPFLVEMASKNEIFQQVQHLPQSISKWNTSLRIYAPWWGLDLSSNRRASTSFRKRAPEETRAMLLARSSRP